MAEKISRRKFVIITLFSGVSLYVAGWWAFKVRKGDASDIIISIIRKKLGYMKIDKSEVKRFAGDFQKTFSNKQRLIGGWAGMLRPFYSLLDIHKITPFSDKFKNFEEYAVTTFLLSCDFFRNGADLSREVKYTVLYDPYEIGCENPFANY
ncbi:MAG: hypothetical protein JSW64_08430 [Candidatus Zixiibacteriota bacterium]|nr:MAG: hypothetical protein JSW64_08430 [candidate division Zixibacteria bacterium]